MVICKFHKDLINTIKTGYGVEKVKYDFFGIQWQITLNSQSGYS